MPCPSCGNRRAAQVSLRPTSERGGIGVYRCVTCATEYESPYERSSSAIPIAVVLTVFAGIVIAVVVMMTTHH